MNITIIIQRRIYSEELTYKMIDNYSKLGNIIVSSYFKNYPQIICIDNNEEEYKN